MRCFVHRKHISATNRVLQFADGTRMKKNLKRIRRKVKIYDLTKVAEDFGFVNLKCE